MIRRIAILPVAALLAAAVAACGSSSATPTATPQPTASPSMSASASVASQSESAAASPSSNVAGASASIGGSFALPSFDLHGAPSLEAAIPGSVNGRSLTKASFSMAQLSALSGGSDTSSDKTFNAWLQSLGKNPSDVNVAVGIAQGTPALTIGAIQVNGADQTKLLNTFLAASQTQDMAVSQTTLGGKSVAKVADKTGTASPSYVYAKGDILYYVQADDDTTAGQALSALP